MSPTQITVLGLLLGSVIPFLIEIKRGKQKIGCCLCHVKLTSRVLGFLGFVCVLRKWWERKWGIFQRLLGFHVLILGFLFFGLLWLLVEIESPSLMLKICLSNGDLIVSSFLPCLVL